MEVKAYESETTYKFIVTDTLDEIEYQFTYEFSIYQLQGITKR